MFVKKLQWPAFAAAILTVLMCNGFAQALVQNTSGLTGNATSVTGLQSSELGADFRGEGDFIALLALAIVLLEVDQLLNPDVPDVTLKLDKTFNVSRHNILLSRLG